MDQWMEKILRLGKKQGHLTYAQVNRYLPNDLDPERLDKVLTLLENNDIVLVDEDEEQERRPQS
jgi:hypothetical protein